MTKLKIACVQVNAQLDMQANVDQACALVREAAAAGADLIGLPENVALMAASEEDRLENAYRPADHPALKAFAEVAKECGIWLQAGSVAALRADGALANHAFLFDDQGRWAADYEKIHMFDVDLPDGSRYRESSMFEPGGQAVLAATPWGPLGMTVCYDLRFPHLYRDLSKTGAVMLTMPSAFTKVTGDAHWEVLLRARAIECGAFVFAPCQTGNHPGGRRTCGHSLIIDPWGVVLADAGTDVGFCIAEIDLAEVEKVRTTIPALQHDRPYAAPATPDRAAAE
ncbi:MAG: carbon-nitrogen hydrolase family protein [Alphaproteobacteria bacterium]|jgi:deaminated glutathione amidase|nr:carbon-nitrogen hydrolase family protein [Rhodospirillaceae bacterium]MBT6510736.1 carbon-nitrogen hydrolase family protein [Rhodospirillaceae bacterium]MDG2482799.1 carbon-nitrogen hydrolase family protein [Alphaproteobacteria bacterium]